MALFFKNNIRKYSGAEKYINFYYLYVLTALKMPTLFKIIIMAG